MSAPETVAGKTASIYGTEMALFKLDLSGKDINEIPEEEPLSEIRSLDLSVNQISSLDFIERCPNIIELDVSENQIADGLEKVGDLDFLANLNLASNLFESLTGFPVSETLMSLDLSKNHLTTVADLPSLPLLEHLNLSHNSIVNLQLPSLPSLKTLNLSGNLITELVLPKLPSLRILDASHNSIEKIQEFEEDSLPFVWKCDLVSNSIQSADVFKSFAKLPMLWTLLIAKNPVVVEDQSHVAPILVILPALTMIDEKMVNAKDKVKANLTVKQE